MRWAISPCLILKTQQQEIMTILFILFKTNRWKWSFFSPHPLHSCNVVPLLELPVGNNFGGEGEECGLFCLPRLPYLGTVSLQFCSSPIVASKETVSLCWSRVKVRKWGYQRRDKVNSQLIVQKHSWFVLIAVFAFTFVCVTSVGSLSRWCYKILFCATSYNKRKSVTTKHEQRFCIYADEKKKRKKLSTLKGFQSFSSGTLFVHSDQLCLSPEVRVGIPASLNFQALFRNSA